MVKKKAQITEYMDNCIFCGRPTNEKHHLVFGSDRQKAEEDGLVIPICSNCHTMNRNTEKIHGNSMACKLSKIVGQLLFESQLGTREEFRKRYGRSFL